MKNILWYTLCLSVYFVILYKLNQHKNTIHYRLNLVRNVYAMKIFDILHSFVETEEISKHANARLIYKI